MYNHYDKEDDWFSLHDCHAHKMSFESGTLSFYYPDGFWVLDRHPQNELHNIVRTDAAKIDYHVQDEAMDEISVSIFTGIEAGKAIREDWEPRS